VNARFEQFFHTNCRQNTSSSLRSAPKAKFALRK
jgi:hypothetical protein